MEKKSKETGWNELIIVSVENNELKTYRTFRKNLFFFGSPLSWKSQENWKDFAEEIDLSKWRGEGYGIVLFDFDKKQAWSFNDYLFPGNLKFPDLKTVVKYLEKTNKGIQHKFDWDEEQNILLKVFLDWEKNPEEWGKLNFKLFKKSIIQNSSKIYNKTLEEWMDGKNKEDFLRLNCLNEKRVLVDRIKGEVFEPINLNYSPEGWKINLDFHFNDSEKPGILVMIDSLKNRGLPHPSEQWLSSFIAQKILDVEILDESFKSLKVSIRSLIQEHKGDERFVSELNTILSSLNDINDGFVSNHQKTKKIKP